MSQFATEHRAKLHQEIVSAEEWLKRLQLNLSREDALFYAAELRQAGYQNDQAERLAANKKDV